VRFHFASEEKLMILVEFPGYPEHKKEHTEFIKEVLSQTEKFNQSKHLVPNRFVYFLKEWILSHVAVCDKVMAEFFLKTKYYKKLELLFPGQN
jgi:hemerythrin